MTATAKNRRDNKIMKRKWWKKLPRFLQLKEEDRTSIGWDVHTKKSEWSWWGSNGILWDTNSFTEMNIEGIGDLQFKNENRFQ